jgi:hypothetical protein
MGTEVPETKSTENTLAAEFMATKRDSPSLDE